MSAIFNGNDNHPVEPGRDKDGDGRDDRCQPNDDSQNKDGVMEDGHDRNVGWEDNS